MVSLTESFLGGIFGGKITSTLLTREIGNGQDDRQLDMNLILRDKFPSRQEV